MSSAIDDDDISPFRAASRPQLRQRRIASVAAHSSARPRRLSLLLAPSPGAEQSRTKWDWERDVKTTTSTTASGVEDEEEEREEETRVWVPKWLCSASCSRSFCLSHSHSREHWLTLTPDARIMLSKRFLVPRAKTCSFWKSWWAFSEAFETENITISGNAVAFAGRKLLYVSLRTTGASHKLASRFRAKRSEPLSLVHYSLLSSLALTLSFSLWV